MAVKDGVVEFRFTIENTGRSLFYSKVSRTDEISTFLEGQKVKFHLEFIFSGFRAWGVL